MVKKLLVVNSNLQNDNQFSIFNKKIALYTGAIFFNFYSEEVKVKKNANIQIVTKDV